ncbi:MAG: hypothetical protein KAI79_08535 [Bacteroidales bacterium]|nr:hypothetical protein [Bacteroidales bacterium]
MNKIKSLIVIILASVLMFSCEKETEEPTINTNTTMSAEDLAVFNKIVSFRSKLASIRANDGLSTKSGEQPLTVDSAVWYIEASLNLMNESYDPSNYNKSVIDTASEEITLTDGMVSWEDMRVTYDAFVLDINETYVNIPQEIKQVKVVDVFID